MKSTQSEEDEARLKTRQAHAVPFLFEEKICSREGFFFLYITFTCDRRREPGRTPAFFHRGREDQNVTSLRDVDQSKEITLGANLQTLQVDPCGDVSCLASTDRQNVC